MADGAPRLLLIAPTHPDLPAISKEVMAFVNARANSAAYDMQLLQGAVDDGAIAHAAGESNYDIWWFATHGSADGVLLTEDFLGIEELAPYIRTSGAKLVVLNSCESIRVGNRIMQQCDSDVIATIAKIGDAVAARTAGMFAVNLLRCGDPRMAYEQARPGGPAGDNYVYLTRFGGGMPGTWSNPGSGLPGVERLMTMTEKTQADVSRLIVDVEVIKTRLQNLEEDLGEIKKRMGNGSLLTPTWQSYLTVLIAIGVFLALALILTLGGIR